ncbi:MAG: hypothetical protein NWE98_01920 [Candidatus Bathyarchaeota archaeon]|nr:hypothetical protein [Candidatus Bathyarchaeota archaeon]
MSSDSQKQPVASRIASYLKRHKVSISLLMAAYGGFYLSTVILSGWTVADWGKDLVSYPPPATPTLLPRSLIHPIFFVTSFPALIVGTLALCVYALRGISAHEINDKEHIAILLVVFGFTYIVIGAWPLGNLVDFPWEWQKQIMRNGAALSWTLYLLGLAALIAGATSVFLHSRIYHQLHPELSLDIDSEC